MAALRNRLARLEDLIGAPPSCPSRVIAVKSYGASQEQVETFLGGQGLMIDHSCDHILHMRIVGGEGRSVAPAIEVMSITPFKKGSRHAW